MARGQQYPSERRFLKDSRTGASITQLSGFPTINSKLYFHVNAFTPDSQSLVFKSYRSMERDAQTDAFKVNVDGTGLVQLTDSPGMGGLVLSYDGKQLFYMVGCELRKVCMSTCEEEVVNRIEGLVGVAGLACTTFDDRYYFAEGRLPGGEVAIVRFRTDGTEAGIVYAGMGITHVQCEPAEGKTIAFQHGPDEQQRNIWLIDADGGNLRPLELKHGNGHWMWVGGSGRIMSNLHKEHQGIVTMKEGDAEVERIADGEHFWHASSSLNGQWFVSDTNWPDNGIQIIHADTKKYKTLCYTGSTSGHSQWTHPHPSFSPDGRYVVYNSDATGIPHVYIAEVPTALLDELGN